MTPQTPSSSGSDSSVRVGPKSAEERLMVAVRVRPLKADESGRALYVLNSKVYIEIYITVCLVTYFFKSPFIFVIFSLLILFDFVKTVVLEDGVDKNDVLRQKRGSDKQYNFDVAFGEESSQEEVYNITTRPLVQDVMNG